MSKIQSINPTGTTEIVTRARTKFSDELGERLILSATDTASISDAALQNGVPPRTLRFWLAEGDAGNPRYEYFAVEFQRARLGHKARWLRNLEEAATHTDRTSGVRANETLLSKFWPKEFGSETFIKTFIERKAAGFDLSMIPSEELRILHKTLAVIKAANEGASKQEVDRLAAKVSKKKDDGPASDSK